MQIDLTQPYFVDALPSPTTGFRPEGRRGSSLSEGKNAFTIRIKLAPPTLGMNNSVKLFDQDDYTQFQSYYDTNVEVNGGNQTYSYIMNQVINNGYLVNFIKINWRFDNFALNPQLQQPLNKVYINANGDIQTDVILGIEDFDIYQRKLSIIDIDLKGQEVLLDGLTYLQYRFVEDPAPLGMFITFFYQAFEKSAILTQMEKDLPDKLTQF